MSTLKNIDAEMAKLREAKKKADMKIQELRRKAEMAKRKNDSRTKLLVGVAVLEALKKGAVPVDTVEKMLDRFITTPRDREFLIENTDFRLGGERKASEKLKEAAISDSDTTGSSQASAPERVDSSTS